jgi:hypothetical protein
VSRAFLSSAKEAGGGGTRVVKQGGTHVVKQFHEIKKILTQVWPSLRYRYGLTAARDPQDVMS